MSDGSEYHDCTQWFISLVTIATQCGFCLQDECCLVGRIFNFFNAQYCMIMTMTTAPLWLNNTLQTKFIFRSSFYTLYYSYKLILSCIHVDLKDFKCFMSWWWGKIGITLHKNIVPIFAKFISGSQGIRRVNALNMEDKICQYLIGLSFNLLLVIRSLV